MTTRLSLMLAFTVVAGCGGAGEKLPADDSFTDLAGADEKSDKFTGRISVVGSLKYGQTSAPVKHPAGKWSAFTFLGNKGDELTINVKSNNGDPVTWLVDKSMEILAYNDDVSRYDTSSQIKYTLPDGANTTFFIVVRDYNRRGMTFTVTLDGKRPGDFASPCTRDAECVLTNAACCGDAFTAVRADQSGAYHDSLNCGAVKCATVLPPSDVLAECLENKCVAVQAKAIVCGGHTINPHACPESFICVGKGLAYDAPGKCERQCGGFGNFQCPTTGEICIDNPFDGCDETQGGADCGGICRDEICSGQTARCAAGYVWSQYDCNCVENPCNLMDCAPLYHCEVTNAGTSGACIAD